MKEHYLAKMRELETKIAIYSERDWLITQALIAELKRVDLILLDLYDKDSQAQQTMLCE